jgi:hypothetical protein
MITADQRVTRLALNQWIINTWNQLVLQEFAFGRLIPSNKLVPSLMDI